MGHAHASRESPVWRVMTDGRDMFVSSVKRGTVLKPRSHQERLPTKSGVATAPFGVNMPLGPKKVLSLLRSSS